MKGLERHGYGIFINTDGYYEGTWTNDKANGVSVFKYFNGDIYNGEYNCD